MFNHNHIVNQIKHPKLNSDNTLHVVGVITNTVRWHSRYRLYREWLGAMENTPHVKVYTVEAALGDRQFEVTESNNPMHLQLRIQNGVWIKENMVNLGIRNLLPSDWKYVSWCDCDVFFKDENWAQETLHQLQHYQVVQPWSDCLDLGPQGEIMQHFKSFAFYKQSRIRIQKWSGEPYPYGHSGFAWACTRYFYENIRGLLDFAILGSSDHHMAWSMTGEASSTIHGKMSAGFHEKCLEWQSWASRACNQQVGYTVGRIEHSFHGSKKKRYYRERWEVLVKHSYDPKIDLTYDAQGVVQILGKPELVHDIHQYNLSRQEDSIDKD